MLFLPFLFDDTMPPFLCVNAVMSGTRSDIDRAVKRVRASEQTLSPISHDDVKSELDLRADTTCASLNCC